MQILVFLLLWTVSAAGQVSPPVLAKTPAGEICADGTQVRVGTYNLLNKNLPHAQNYPPWDLRSRLLAQWILSEKVDILGTQEAVDPMLVSLRPLLPDYVVIGRVRSEDPLYGEYSALFINRTRFQVLRSGDFWLSETPDQAASLGWDASLPRVATWAELQDLRSSKKLFVINAHFDHRGSVARVESSKLLVAKARELSGGLPIVFLGDFNAEVGTEVLEPLATAFQDARVATLTAPQGGPGTYLNGKRIDHVFADARWKVCRYAVQTPRSPEGQELSDHLPVVVDLMPHGL